VAEWTAEVPVGEELARRLIGEQFPDLAARGTTRSGSSTRRGVFRFPRREIAVPLVERELAVLPQLESTLPLAIPAPVFSGRPTDAYPWPFLGSRYLPGSELGSAELNEDAEVTLAGTLGHCLSVLYSSEVARMVSGLYALPVDPNSRTDIARRVPSAREALEAASGRSPAFVESDSAPRAPRGLTRLPRRVNATSVDRRVTRRAAVSRKRVAARRGCVRARRAT
jgi:aminoglycoside phosphotransferase (APT) family kinase protein